MKIGKTYEIYQKSLKTIEIQQCIKSNGLDASKIFDNNFELNC